MADGIDAINYGWKPSGLLQGYLGEQENMYVRARREQLAEEAKTARAQEQANKDIYNKYLQAQMDKWKTEEKDIGGLKAAQADQLKEQAMYPAMKAIADAGKAALEKGDMGGVMQAAERYNMIQNQLPQSVRQALGRPQTFSDKTTGRTVESNYDPQLLADMAENAARSKGIATLQQQGMKGEQQMDVEKERTARALQVQKMRADIDRAKQAAKAAGNQKLETLITQLETAYLYEDDPVAKEDIKSKLQHAVVVASQLKPQPMETVITPEGTIGREGRNIPPTVPDVKPKQGTRENPIKLD